MKGVKYHMGGARSVPTTPDPPPVFPVYDLVGETLDSGKISAETREIISFKGGNLDRCSETLTSRPRELD